MKIELPKELNSFVFTELSLVELNSLEVERLLTHIYELAIKGGRYGKALTKFYEEDYRDYLAKLLSLPTMNGFDCCAEGSEVVDNWLRASVVAFGRSGTGHGRAKMDYIRPRTVAAYRAGFPDRRRSRQADTAIYVQMINDIERRKQNGLIPESVNVQKLLGEWVKEAVGEGVDYTKPPGWLPYYDGSTQLDISTLLTLRFLEGFNQELDLEKLKDPVDPGFRKRPAVPAAASPLGSDALDYLVAYRDSTPLQTARHLSAILGLRLYQLPLRTTLAIRELLQTDVSNLERGLIPGDMARIDNPNPLESYVDFSGDPASESRALARACVQRDLRLMQVGLRDRLLLMIVKRAAEIAERIPADYKNWTGPDRFSLLAKLARDEDLARYFQIDLHEIRKANSKLDALEVDQQTQEYLEKLDKSGRPAIDRVVEIVLEAKRSRARHAISSFMRDTGGLNRANGLLAGVDDSRRRDTWGYVVGNDLLTALLAVVFTDARSVPRREMMLSEVLHELSRRFGILIGQPPDEFNTVSARGAASANLEAFKRRLKLLGVFDGLSDDFSAQIVTNPLLTGASV